MSGLQGVRVGDTIMASTFGRPAKPVDVATVGRVWLTADRTQFAIADGRMKGGYAGMAYTLDEYAEFEEVGRLRRVLRDAGVEIRGSLPTDQMRAIVAIVDPTSVSAP